MSAIETESTTGYQTFLFNTAGCLLNIVELTILNIY